MTRMIGPYCEVTYNLINKYTQRQEAFGIIIIDLMGIHTHARAHTYTPLLEDQCEWRRITRMTEPDCAVMCNLINTPARTNSKEARGKQKLHRG